MICREFKPSDLKSYATWCEARNCKHWIGIKLPETGLIINDIAAAFLVETNSSFCLIEFLITNPESSATDREKAMILLCKELENKASEKGFKKIVNLVEHNQVGMRLIDAGYSLTSVKSMVFMKELQ